MLLERNEELQRQLETLSTQHSEREEVSWRQGWAKEQVAGARQVGRGRGGGQVRTGEQGGESQAGRHFWNSSGLDPVPLGSIVWWLRTRALRTSQDVGSDPCLVL